MCFLACTHLVNDLPAEQMAARLELICARSMEYLSKVAPFTTFSHAHLFTLEEGWALFAFLYLNVLGTSFIGF